MSADGRASVSSGDAAQQQPGGFAGRAATADQAELVERAHDQLGSPSRLAGKVVVTATTVAPAARPARMPTGASSTTRQAPAGTPRRAAACR
jgi:hypothetical protein